MEKIYYIPAAIAAATYFIKDLLHSLHMLQVSSYRNERFWVWCKNNRKKLIKTGLQVFIPGMAASVAAWYFLSFSLILITALFLIAAVVYKLPPAKKPLVLTARAKRLFATCMAIVILIFAIGYFLSWPILFVLAGVSAPITAILGNFMNTPIEKAVYNRYFTEAQNKLAARKDLVVIGVAGSYGKTSTKFALEKILSVAFKTLVTPDSYNTPMGLSKVIRTQLSDEHEVFVAEMGAGKVGDIEELCKLLDPDHGVLCSIGPQHLETMGSMDNILKTNFALAGHVDAKNGTMFLNDDNKLIAEHPVKGSVVRYGTTPGLDVWAEDISTDAKGTSFTLCFPDGQRYSCTTRLLGRYNVLNILAAVSVGKYLGISVPKMIPAIGELEPVPHRLQLISRDDGLTVIDDTHNSNPNGAKMALETLSCFEGLRILVTPGMVGLGIWEKEFNKEMGMFAANCCNLMILVGGERVLPIADGAKEAGFDPKRILRCPTMQAALAEAESYLDQHPVVLLENDLPDNYN